MHTQTPAGRPRTLTRVGSGIVLAAIAVTAFGSWLLYEHTVTLLTENLRERLLSISITQAANVDADNLAALQAEDDWTKPEWARVVSRLKRAKDDNPNIVFMYVFRKKPGDPTRMEFVADAESLNPYANLDDDPINDVDANGDGVIEPDGADKLQWPGQDYPEAVDIPEAFEAYLAPLTARELYEDSYGQVLTGYAPIKDASGTTVAVLATDIKADAFLVVTRQTLYPFLSFIAFLVLAIVVLSGVIIGLWDRRIRILAETDRVKNEVIGTVAHQLNGVVTKLQWFTEMLRDASVSKEECADSVEADTAELKSLTGLFLDAARIHESKLQLQPVALDLNTFFARLVRSASTLAQSKSIRLTTSIPEHLPTALLDENYTYFALENLLSNAVKYTTEGGRVDFAVEVDADVLKCRVRDTGIGIPKDARGKMFGQMYRASNAKSIKGNGLGLYITRYAIVEQGGKIWYDSEGVAGKGTTFQIELPLKRDAVTNSSNAA